MTAPPKRINEHLIAGTLGGFVSTVTLHPLELIKIRMQVSESNNDVYRSFFRSCRLVLQTEGPKGFFKGVTPAMIAASGSWGGYFYFYEWSKSRKLMDSEVGSKLGTLSHLSAGIEAGAIMVLMFNPFWVIKTRMALEDAKTAQSSRYNGVSDALRRIYKEEGFAGLYRGIVPALLLTSHGAIQFAVYEKLKTLTSEYADSNSTVAVMQESSFLPALTGGTSKVIASLITYPYQLIKSRLQQRSVFNDATQTMMPKYSGVIDCATKILRYEGPWAFFKGCLPNVLKVAPSAAVTFFVYEQSLKVFKN